MQVATLCYKPPELLLGDSDYNFAFDIWAVGCIFGTVYFISNKVFEFLISYLSVKNNTNGN